MHKLRAHNQGGTTQLGRASYCIKYGKRNAQGRYCPGKSYMALLCIRLGVGLCIAFCDFVLASAMGPSAHELLVTITDTWEVQQAIDPDMLFGDMVLSGLIAACQTLQPPQSSLVAWSLWQHSLALGYSLSDAAADALWHTQLGQGQTLTEHCHLLAICISLMYMQLTHPLTHDQEGGLC